MARFEHGGADAKDYLPAESGVDGDGTEPLEQVFVVEVSADLLEIGGAGAPVEIECGCQGVGDLGCRGIDEVGIAVALTELIAI